MPTVLLPKGIYCPRPECRSTKVIPTSWSRPTSGARVRYFFCKACRHRFKTIERIAGATKRPWNGNRADGNTAS